MLVLTRQVDEDIRIGSDITVKVLSIRGGQVRLGIEAPTEVTVHRGELLDAVQDVNEAAAQADNAAVPSLKQIAALAFGAKDQD